MAGPMSLLQEVAKTFSAHRQNTFDEPIIGFDPSRVSPNELYKLESAFGPHGQSAKRSQKFVTDRTTKPTACIPTRTSIILPKFRVDVVIALNNIAKCGGGFVE
jgi:hypothetical protein